MSEEEYEKIKSLLYTGELSQYGKRKLIEYTEKQTKIINKMAEQLRGMAVLDTDKDEMIILGDDEDVIKYYEGKVE